MGAPQVFDASSSYPSPAQSSWPSTITRKLIRALIACVAIHFILSRLYYANSHLDQSLPEASESQIVAQDEVVPEPQSTLYPPQQFPDSSTNTLANSQHNGDVWRPWLVAVTCTAADAERRAMIRASWMKLFRDVPFDGRFVLADPGPYIESVAEENKTFGDLIVLDHVRERDLVANEVKALELFEWLVDHRIRYTFVTKIETDVWLNARRFWDKFLEPRISNETGQIKANARRTVIGELAYSISQHFAFPHEAMYTVSWDTLEWLVRLHDAYPVVTWNDRAVTALMLKGKERSQFVNFRPTEKFAYEDADSRRDGTAWARERTHPESPRHALGNTEAIVVDGLKTTEDWFKVAVSFDEKGMKERPPRLDPDPIPPFSLRWSDFWYMLGMPGRYESRFRQIPDSIWSFEDGDWICGGIWNLGKTKAGYVDA
ncbi:hypothetical protein B0T10DRAFT_479420 [Thelonectria olida]|uniref:Hexosyltransferase n=1 Tax=Thelonectria olida TaxID=1576542 RepID=A0A9P8W9D4_9HYPO|nr:hypothetical protein B0T10DRAFT_479420 [Thelonectria olida]